MCVLIMLLIKGILNGLRIHIWSLQWTCYSSNNSSYKVLVFAQIIPNQQFNKIGKPVNNHNINTHLMHKNAPVLIRRERAFPCYWFVGFSELKWEFERSGGNSFSGEGKVTDRHFLLFNSMRLATVQWSLHANTSEASHG